MGGWLSEVGGRSVAAPTAKSFRLVRACDARWECLVEPGEKELSNLFPFPFSLARFSLFPFLPDGFPFSLEDPGGIHPKIKKTFSSRNGSRKEISNYGWVGSTREEF